VKLKVLLCLLDGAERRRHLQDKLNALLARGWRIYRPSGGEEVDSERALQFGGG
jgi:hypothetical protein